MPTQKFPEMPELICAVCKKQPEDISEYVQYASEGETASDFCWAEEGTLDRTTGMFLCTEDYIALGQPSTPEGWIATRENLQKLGVQP